MHSNLNPPIHHFFERDQAMMSICWAAGLLLFAHGCQIAQSLTIVGRAQWNLAAHRRVYRTKPARKQLLASADNNPRDAPGWSDILESVLEESDTFGSSLISQPSRRRIAIGGDDFRTVLASSNSFAGTPSNERAVQNQIDRAPAQADPDDDDPYSEGLSKIQNYQQQSVSKPTLEQRLKNMDLQDVIATLIIPGIIVFASGRWVYNRVKSRVSTKLDTELDSFARELLYHDGDFTEMQLCINDYKTKLMYMPNRNDLLLKRYLAAYAKKKTVSPQAISSISYVFTCFALSEEQAAQVLVRLCQDLGTDKISSSGKLLFLGSRILRSPEGQEALIPIKELIMSTYRDERVAETLVDTSQQAMAEASYRSVVQTGGKEQSSLTPGWEVLGLDRAKAEQIFTDVQKEGFMTDREAMYGGQTRKYDKKGRRLTNDGKLVNPEDADDDDDNDMTDDNMPASNVYECSECGYTLFVAKGRESKFFGSGFRCPECGAAKKKFKARDDVDDTDEYVP